MGNSKDASRVQNNIFDQLVSRNFDEDPEGRELRPALATHWEQTDDTTWIFTIRDDVLFHNGDRLSAEDVAFSLGEERILGAQALVPIGRRYTELITSARAIDETTLEIKTEVNVPNLPFRFITPLGYIVPKKYYLEVGPDAFGQRPIGTGPFRVNDFDPAAHLKLAANRDYWGGRPTVETVEFRAVPEYSARLAGVVSGEFKIISDIPPDEASVIHSIEGVEYVAQREGNYVMLAYNTLSSPSHKPNPVSNRNLRYAMTAAIDRDLLVSALWGDATYSPAAFNFEEFPGFFEPDRKPKIKFDLEMARAYLAASDYDGERFNVNVMRGAYPQSDLAIEYIVEQWNKIGIRARLNIVDSWALALRHPFGVLNISMDTAYDGTPTRSLWGFWGPESARATRERDKSWSPPAKFTALGRRFVKEADPRAKRQLFRELVDIWETEQPGMILWRRVGTWVIRDDITWCPIASPWILLGPGFLHPNHPHTCAERG